MDKKLSRKNFKKTDFKKITKKLLKYVSEYKVFLILASVFSCVAAVLGVIGPKVLGNATDEILTGLTNKIKGIGGIDFQSLGHILFGLFILYASSCILRVMTGIIMTSVTQRTIFRLRKEISEKINRMPMKFFDGKPHGEILSIITNDADTLSYNLNDCITQSINAAARLIGVIWMMFSVNVSLTLIAFVVLPLSAFLVMQVVKRSQKYFRQQQACLGHVNAQIEEAFSGIEIIQSFGTDEEAVEMFEKENNLLAGSTHKSRFISGLMQPTVKFIGNLGYVAVCIFGSIFAAGGKITVGGIQSFITYMRNFAEPISSFAEISNMFQSLIAAAERVFALLESPEETDVTALPQTDIDPSTLQGNVEFSHVKFGYNPEKIVINDFCAMAKKGQKIAIVGPTGAGKTTVVKLLMRFYDLNDGKILIDGHDIASFDRHDIRKVFGMVLQDAILFSGSISDNIRYGKLDATDDEIIAAAKACRADEFISALPNGYETEVSEDASNLSQGQRQLITIARTVLANPKILILDEATSSVDTRTELLIQKATDALASDRTSFIIAHRLSTVKNADLILVIRDGDIVEQGTHEQLLSYDSFYSEIYNSQFKK